MTFSHHFSSTQHNCGQLTLTNRCLTFSFLQNETCDSQKTNQIGKEFIHTYELYRPLAMLDYLEDDSSSDDSDDSDDETDTQLLNNPRWYETGTGFHIRFTFENPITLQSIQSVLALIGGMLDIERYISKTSFEELNKAIKDFFENQKTEFPFFSKNRTLQHQQNEQQQLIKSFLV